MATVLSPPKTVEGKVVLHNISWHTYQSLLEERGDCSAPRLTYDRGELEIMSPTAKHEVVNESIKLIVNLISMEIGPIVWGLGSTTFARADLDRGFEPDSCFYVRNAAQIRGKERIDLSVDPVPDIVVEIDITSSSVNTRKVFAHFGVPEVWRYDGAKIEILTLTRGSYLSSDVSLVLPVFTAEALTKLVADSLTLDRPDWMNGVRDWARAEKGSQ